MINYNKQLPFEKYRNTIFNNKKNIDNQFLNKNEKRHTDKIIEQTPFNFYFTGNNKHDRSIAPAITKQNKIESFALNAYTSNKQKNTIFSTPSDLNTVVNYKGIISKAHNKNQFESDSMKKALDYNFKNSNNNANNNLKYTKNIASAGNPITWNNSKAIEQGLSLKNKGRFHKDIYQTTGDFGNYNNKQYTNKNIPSKDLGITTYQQTNVFRKSESMHNKVLRNAINRR